MTGCSSSSPARAPTSPPGWRKGARPPPPSAPSPSWAGPCCTRATPSTAEWNFWVDPHAAKVAFTHAGPGHPITLAPLNVTEQLLLDRPGLDKLLGALAATPIAADLSEMLRFYFEFHEATGDGYQAQIHDLLTCMSALHTVEFCTTETTGDVEADSQLTRGTSLADYRGHWNLPANAYLVTEADIPAAWAEFHAAARTLAQVAASR